MNKDTTVTSTAAPRMGKLRLKLERLSVEETPHIIMNAKANARLMWLKKSNIALAVGYPYIYPTVYMP